MQDVELLAVKSQETCQGKEHFHILFVTLQSVPSWKCPLCVILGHSQPLNHWSWRHDGQWLITSSDDKSAKLWMSSNPEPVMTIANMKGNIAPVNKESGSKTDKVRISTLKL